MLAPGWSTDEVDALKKGLMKFGIGKWIILDKSQVLPTKPVQAMYLQTQRILGS
jgi:hypothetical protein